VPAELITLEGRVRERLRRTAEDILAIGEDLIRAKALVGHGSFGAWLELTSQQVVDFRGGNLRWKSP